jgi:hypothetical protein
MKPLTLLTTLLIMVVTSFAQTQELRGEIGADASAGKPYIYKHSAGKPRQMEIYFPPGHDPVRAKVPSVILFQAGSWSGGNLNPFHVACAYFASRGLVCATAGGHIIALATMNPGLKDPADPKAFDTSIVAYLWFNRAFGTGDTKDPEIGILRHLKANLPPAIVFFGDQDPWKKGWDTAHAKWEKIGTPTIDLQIAPGQSHSFFNKDPWRTVTLIAADRFLVKQGLLTGEPTLQAPATGETLIPFPQPKKP